MDKPSSFGRRLTGTVIAILVLCICLCGTTFALVYSMVEVENNLFQTGRVEINLNDGKRIIEESEFLFEPGMTVQKEFFLENLSTCQVYYKLYFQNVRGNLAKYLEITVFSGDKILYSGTPETLERADVTPADDILEVGEKRELTVAFHFPEGIGNEAQGLYLSFDFAADAVQTKNNPGREFD